MLRIYDSPPEGLHRCRIRSARKDVSKAGNEVIRVTVEVYGYDDWIKYYVVFLPGAPDRASRQIREIFDSAPDIADVYELRRWTGAECACVIGREDLDGRTVPRISAFVPASAQSGLPHFPDLSAGGVVVYDTICGEEV